MIGIYKITNKTNGHCYVGQSIDIKRRWRTHIMCAKNSRSKGHEYPLQRAIRKYGVEVFAFEVLLECSKQNLTKWEQYFYNILKPEYNQIFPNENPVFNPEIESRRQAIFKTKEYRQKCSKPHSEEFKRTMSEIIRHSEKYKTSHNTPEYKQKLKEIRNKGKRKDIPVIMWNDDIKLEFSSMSECARWLNNNTKYQSKNKVSKIKAVCDNERKQAFGYKYTYK